MGVGYFRIQADNNLTGLRARMLTIETFEFYRYQVASVDFDRADLGKLVAQLQADGLDGTQHTIRRMLGFTHRLVSYFPKLAHIALTQGLISVPMACAIEGVLQDLPAIPDAAMIRYLEDILVRKLTPKRRNQHLPSPRALRTLLECALRESGLIGTPIARPEFWCSRSTTPGMWSIHAEVDAAAGAMINRHVTAVANANHIPEVEAFIQLLTGNTEATTVTIFGIGHANPSTPITIDELAHTGTPETDAATTRLKRLRIKYRNILELAAICRASHDPGPILQALIQFRDGHCRYPGCTIPAHRCDIDHVINHDAGGWTCLANLQCLCRHHHNMKTDRKLHATITPDGAVTWFDTDPRIGEEHRNLGTTLPEGPLAGLTGTPMPPRHSGKTQADDNTTPPTRHGMGRFGSTFNQYNTRIHELRNLLRTPPHQIPEPPF